MIEKIKTIFKNNKLASLFQKNKLKTTAIFGGIALILVLLGLIQVPSMLQSKELRGLGYSNETITEIRSQKLTNVILKNDYYSSNLAQAISNKNLNKNYISLYVVMEQCTSDDFLLYDRLEAKGYSKEALLALFKNLKFYEITPLLVFDYQSNIQTYLDDALAHQATNSSSNFTLTNTYIEPYAQTYPVFNEGNYDMLVNKQYYLNSGFAPASLPELSTRYASSGITLDAGAADALKELCENGRSMGLVFYALSGFRPYSEQEKTYNNNVGTKGQQEADLTVARPGFSEHQTGLSIDLAAGGESRGLPFAESPEFSWVRENAENYGWILRYPEGKEQITGYSYEPWHYRYVGKEIALKVKASGLTYDEYYLLYVAPLPEKTTGDKQTTTVTSTETPTEVPTSEPEATPVS